MYPFSAYPGGVETTNDSYYEIHKPFMSINCLNEQTQQEVDTCSRASIENAKSKMESLLNELKLLNDQQALVVSDIELSQTYWSEYMKATCSIETKDSKDGSAYYSILSDCLETKINERNSYLQWLLDIP